MPIPAASDPEIKICGAHACSAVAQRRPEDVRRVYITEAMMPSFGEFLRWCASQRLAYHVVDEAELERITQSVHHGGVAFIVRQPPPPTLGSLLHRLRGEDPSTPRVLIYLDNVQNPHNLGAIVRVAAHFGADGVLLAGEATSTSTSMTRTAEGGAEFIDVVPVALGQRPLLAARAAGFTLVATTSHGRDSLYGDGLPPRTVIMLGSESHGLAPSVFGLADMTVTIPGSGQVESLNVACAAAVLLAEHWRAHREVDASSAAAAPNRVSDRPCPAEGGSRPEHGSRPEKSGRGDRLEKDSRGNRPEKSGRGNRPPPQDRREPSGRESKENRDSKESKENRDSRGAEASPPGRQPRRDAEAKPGKPRSGKPRKSGKPGARRSQAEKPGAGKGAVSPKPRRAGKPRPSSGPGRSK